MANSIQRAVSDGSLQSLGVSIAFFDQVDILVSVDGVRFNDPADYTWISSNTIRFNQPIDYGKEVILRRFTDRNDVRHVFSGGSPFNYATLDEDFLQILYIAQENSEGAEIADVFTNINMHENRIINLGNPIAGGDAVNKRTLDQVIADVVAAGSGPMSSAANVLYVYPDNRISNVQSLSGPVGAEGIGDRFGTVADTLRRAVPTVFDFDEEKRLGQGDVAYDTRIIQQAIWGTTGALSLGEGKTRFSVDRLTGRPDLDLQGNGTLDFGAGPNMGTMVDPLFRFQGAAMDTVMLTADAAPGSRVISVTSTSKIAAGDVVEIATPGHNGGFIDTSVGTHNGESRRVLRVLTPTSIELSEPIIDEFGYAVAHLAQLRVFRNMSNVTIGERITIRGHGRPVTGAGDIGMVFYYGVDIKIGCRFERVDSSAVRFESCYNAHANWCRVIHDAQGPNGAVNYGIVPSCSSSYIRITNCYFANMRHAVVTSHVSIATGLGLLGVVRNLDISNCYIVNTWHAGIATHNDADRVKIYDCTFVGCFQGANPRERNIEITRCTFIRCGQGVSISAHPRNLSITDCTFEDCTGSAVIGVWGGTRDASDIFIARLRITRCVGGVTLTLPAPIVAHKRIYVEDLFITNCVGAGGAQSMVRIGGASYQGGALTGIRIRAVSGSSGIAILNGAEDVPIMNNVVRDITGNAFSTVGTLVNVHGKYNVLPLGAWSGQSSLTNASTFLADNTNI